MKKYAIIATMPSGNKYAFATFDGKFALAPVDGGMFRKAFAWDTEKEAMEHLVSQLAVAPGVARLGDLSVECCEVPE